MRSFVVDQIRELPSYVICTRESEIAHYRYIRAGGRYDVIDVSSDWRHETIYLIDTKFGLRWYSARSLQPVFEGVSST